MKFLDVFNKIKKGNYALTDESIYMSIKNNDELIPLYGGNRNHVVSERQISISAKTKKGCNITIFSGEGIIISLDGSAGSMTYKIGESFALNHHAGFITLNKKSENLVNLEFFALFFEDFYRNLSVSDGSKTLSLEQIYSEEFNLPSIEFQNYIMGNLDSKMNIVKHLLNIKQKYIDIGSKTLFFNINKEIPLNQILKYCSRNDCLSESGIYYHTTSTNDIKVLSGSDDVYYGNIDSSTLNIHCLKNKQCLHVISRGNAGKLTYLPLGNYATNTNAFLLYLKDDYKKSHNIDTDLKELYILKFLLYYLQPIFYESSSNSDLGVFPLTDIFKTLIVPDISYSDDIINYVDWHEKVKVRIKHIESIENQYKSLLSKQVLYDNI